MLILMQHYQVSNDLSSPVNFLKRMAQLFFEPLVLMRHSIKKNIEKKKGFQFLEFKTLFTEAK